MGRGSFVRCKIIMNTGRRIAQRPKAGQGGATPARRNGGVRFDHLQFLKSLIKNNNYCGQVSWRASNSGQ
jgi:hypothetical protein